MADNGESKSAGRIITDLHAGTAVRPKEHVVWSPELYRETTVLARADLELARMLDELDAKITGHNQETMVFALGVTDAIQALQIRCAQLEARTFPGRIRRFKAWWAQWLDAFREPLDVFPDDELELPPPTSEASPP